MVAHWIELMLATVAGLLPIANPFSTTVVLLAITRGFGEERKRQQTRMACIYMAAVLLVFLFAGALIMEFFGISIPAVRIAGGLIVARIGFGMLQPEPEEEMGEEARQEALHMQDVAFTPLAVPMLSGPGSIAVTLGMAAGADGLWENLAVAAGIVIVAFLSWLVLRAAGGVVRVLGATGMNALTRVMGFLLVCVGIQLLGIGVVEVATNERVVGAILEAAARARPSP